MFSENKVMKLFFQIIELVDVVFKDEFFECKVRNERWWVVVYYGKMSGFEIVYGLLDCVMMMLKVVFVMYEEGLEGKSIDYVVKENLSKVDGYFIQEIDELIFFKGRVVVIYVRLGGELKRIGELGVLYLMVLEKFDLRYLVSILEINFEVFF